MPLKGCWLGPLLIAWCLATVRIADAATTTTSRAATTSSTGVATHTIQVGPKTSPHAYVPAHITANPGDTVVFEFYPTNHSVVKADYMAPCVPATEDVFYSGAFDTFNQKDGQLVGAAPTWSLVVNDTEPTFFYCTAIDSCLVNGMVGVINPNSSQTFEEQYKQALKYPYMLVPGQSPPAEGDGSDSSSSSSSTSGGSSGGHGLSTGAIVGIAISCTAFVAILGALLFFIGRNRVYHQWMSSEDGRNERTARWLFQSQTGTRDGTESSTTKRPPTEITTISSPDSSKGLFTPPMDASPNYTTSPHNTSGQWSWDDRQNLRVNRGPTELEADSVPRHFSGVRDLPMR